jgi:outer membrane protein assembly factor BamB
MGACAFNSISGSLIAPGLLACFARFAHALDMPRIALLLFTAVTVGCATGSEWPTFHGTARDNISRETGLLKQWPESGPPLAWRRDGLGRGYAAVSFAEGRLFTSGDFGEDEYVIALDLNGNLLWKTQNGRAWRGAQPGARTTPTYDEGRVFHLGPHGDLTAFWATNGAKIWSINIRTQFDANLGLWGYTENLVVEGDRVFCMPGGASGRVVALDKRSGRTLWANTRIPDRAGYSSPIIVTHDGVRQFVTLARSTVFGVDVRDGKLLWLHKHEGFCDQNVTSPIYHAGKVFVSSGHKAGARVVELQANSAEPKELWFGTRLDNCHGGVVLRDGHLYGSGCRMYNKGLHCVEFDTGKVVYQAEEIGKVSLTYADGRFYCLDNDGVLLLVEASPRGAKVISRYPLPRNDNDNTLAHPVVCAGRLYARHHEHLWAFNVRDATWK